MLYRILLFVNLFAYATCTESVDVSCFDDQKLLNKTKVCKNSIENINWKVVDAENGIIDMEFYMDLEYEFNMYQIRLEIDENVHNEENCLEDKDLNYTLHSLVNYRRVNSTENNLSKCTEKTSVRFTHIFNGCYVLNIKALNYIGDRFFSCGPPLQKIYYFQNFTYEKTLIEPLEITQQYRKSDNALFITVNTINTSYNNKFKFSLEHLVTHKCIKWYTPCKMDTCQAEVCDESKQIIDETNIKITCIMKYDEKTAKAELAISGLPGGNYKITAELISDPIRCRTGDNIWQKSEYHSCKFASDKISIEVLEAKEPESSEFGLHGYIIGIIIAVVIILFVILILLFAVRSGTIRKKMLRQTGNSEQRHLIEKPKIFLLYPRDCEEIMRAMAAFRNLLINCAHLEVFDMHDPNMSDEIDKAPADWIRNLIGDDNVKTILVLTQCANLMAKTNIPKVHNLYKDQECYDSLYPYAIRMLSEHLRFMSYSKLLLTRFNFDNAYYKSFRFFTPFVRYGIPTNLDKLLGNFTNVQQTHIEDTTEYKFFRKSLNILQEFLQTQPDYIKNVLNVELGKQEDVIIDIINK